MREPTPQELIGGRYLLQSRLGEGGMGSVWEATHRVTRRRHALKFLKGHLGQREDLRRRFAREARAASMVRHPSVVDIQDLFELDDGTLVMVMELLEGRTLGARIREARQLSLGEIASYLVRAVSAVGSAHALGIVHRDLKPENIFLAGPADAPDVRVLDFGIAKLVEPETSVGITNTGALLGTPCYMSPEQALGEGTADHRTDIWSFGVILYEALVGARPVEGENLGQVLKRLVSDGITPIEVIVPDLPEEVAQLIGRMLSQDPEDRPQDLREVMAVLERHTTVRAPSFGPPTSRPTTEDRVRVHEPEGEIAGEPARKKTDEAADTVAELPPPASRRGRSWVGLAAASAMVVAAAAFWMSRGDRTTQALPAATPGERGSPTVMSDVPAPKVLERATESPRVEPAPPPPEPSPAGTVLGNVKARVVARSSKTPVPAGKSVAQATENGPTAARPSVRAAQDGFVDDPPF